MTNEDLEQREQLLREALDRFTGRFEPTQPDWARIDARWPRSCLRTQRQPPPGIATTVGQPPGGGVPAGR